MRHALGHAKNSTSDDQLPCPKVVSCISFLPCFKTSTLAASLLCRLFLRNDTPFLLFGARGSAFTRNDASYTWSNTFLNLTA